MKMRGIVLLLLVIAALPVMARAQSLGDSEDFSSNVSSAPCPQLNLTYTRPHGRNEVTFA